jgi:hypothetical protein
MGVVCYRCPNSGAEIMTAIETDQNILTRMREFGLTIWVGCPHCVSGHQIKPADAILTAETPAPSLAAG